MRILPGWNELGWSLEDRPIRAYSNFSAHFHADFASGSAKAKAWTLILGGTHGDERATVPFLEAFVSAHLEDKTGATGLGPVMVLPLLNPDGYARDSRYNARGVDLNRNLPELWSSGTDDEPPGTGPLSEPESRLLHDLLVSGKPARIVSLHWALSEIDPDGEGAYAWARSMWENLEDSHRSLFRLREPDNAVSLLPGSLGSFCRLRLRDTTWLVTLELPYHVVPELDPLPEDHFATVRALWETDRERYWNAVYPAVESMLRFAIGTKD